ncbi:MAG: response regulator transcription factor [Pseudobdellovibrionaceae bacterium]
MSKILCVEDAADTIMVLEATLASHQLAIAQSLSEAQTLLAKENYSLLILDIELPDGNGLEFMASYANEVQGLPVIFLTGKNDFTSKASAFSLGAEDFIVKPFDPRELRLRVDAKLKKYESAQDANSVIKVGPLVCNIEEQRVFANRGQKAIDLTSIEFRIFHLLAKAQNKIFTRAEILDKVWGKSISVTDRSVDVHVSNLRRKLTGSGVNIEAVIGTGYRILIEK